MFKRWWIKSHFDEAWYLAAYPDVHRALELGLFKNAFDHYWNFGRKEGRLSKEPFVDEDWYVHVYEDVREGIARGEFKSASDHFVKIGSREGRLPRPLHFQVSISKNNAGVEPRGGAQP